VYLLGIDLGTSSIKAGIFTGAGAEVAVVDRECLTIPEDATRIEIDPDVYWLATAEVIRDTLAAAGVAAGEIVALSISSHGETLFLVDEAGHPVRDAILTLDARAVEEAEALASDPGRAAIYELTGQPDVLPIWPAAKIAWIRENEPDAFTRTARFLLPQGYIVQQLCGRPADSPSVLATSLLFDIWRGDWSQPLLATCGAGPERLAEVLPAGAIAGRVLPAAARATGLAPGTPVVTGALDQVCAAVAAGNVEPGILSESTGSVLATLVTAPAGDGWRAAIRSAGLPIYPHALPGRYCLLPWHQTGGLALKWFRDRFGSGMGGDGFQELTAAAAQVPPGSDGLIALPHFEGSQFPESVPAARAVFFAVSLTHGLGHFTRAIMESIAYLLARDIVALAGAGVPVERIIALGGGAKSALWTQIKADACGLPVETLACPQAALLGAAMLAATGVGYYDSLPEAARAMSLPGPRFLPDAAAQAAHRRNLAMFVELHRRLLDLF
jgi:xylulokinase